jgi:antitoxin component YwqK of YwqJK toxin-antitoxin module
MQSVTSEYENGHADELVNAVGMPSEERVIMERRILTWYVENSGVIPITLPTTSTATIYGYGGTTNVTITSSETTYHSFNYNCKLEAVVTDTYEVINIMWEGDVVGCRTFYNNLKGWSSTKKKWKKDHIEASYGNDKEKYEIDICVNREGREIFSTLAKDREELKKLFLATFIREDILKKWCENNKTDGLYQTYYENGQLKQSLNVKFGHANGETIKFTEDGIVSAVALFNKGKIDGIGKIYHPNGKLHKEFKFDNGIKEGVHKSYWENGKLYEKCSYKFNKKNGSCESYRDNGQLIKKENYKNGKLIK